MEKQVVDHFPGINRISTLTIVTKAECVQDNVECFGMAEAAKMLAKKKVPFAIAYWLLMGKAPRSQKMHTYPVARQVDWIAVVHREVIDTIV